MVVLVGARVLLRRTSQPFLSLKQNLSSLCHSQITQSFHYACESRQDEGCCKTQTLCEAHEEGPDYRIEFNIKYGRRAR